MTLWQWCFRVLLDGPWIVFGLWSYIRIRAWSLDRKYRQRELRQAMAAPANIIGTMVLPDATDPRWKQVGDELWRIDTFYVGKFWLMHGDVVLSRDERALKRMLGELREHNHGIQTEAATKELRALGGDIL